MRPVSLTFEHFGSYRERQHIDFNALDDFFLIYGKTGSGKTTIFDAIAFALYGQALGGRSNLERELASKFSPVESKPWVEFEFIASDARWRVYRTLPYRKKNRKGVDSEAASEVTLTRLHDSGETELVTDRLAEANAALLRLLKLRMDEFSKIVLLPQGAFQEFLEMKTSDRVEILEKLFDVSVYERVAERAHLDAVELDASLRSQRDEMERLAAELGAEPDQSLEREALELQGIDEELSRATRERSNLDTEIDRTRDQLVFWKEIADAWEALAGIEAEKPSFEARAERLGAARSLGEIAGSGQRLCDQYTELVSIAERAIGAGKALALLERERLEIEAEDASLTERRSARDALQRSIALLQRAVEEWAAKAALERGVMEHERQLEVAVAELGSREAEIEELKRGNAELEGMIGGEAEAQEGLRTCLMAGEALRRIGGLVDQVERFEAEREKILRKISGTEDSLSALDREIAEFEARRDTLEAQARHARAGSLAATLVEGHPCPVCGSPTHPRPAELFESAPSDATLRQASAEVEGRKSRRAALTQSVQSDRERAEILSADRAELAERLSAEWAVYTELAHVAEREPDADVWRAALRDGVAALSAKQGHLKSEIDRCGAARASLAQRRQLLDQRERDAAAAVRQKSELELARTEAAARLASLAQSIGHEDPAPQLASVRAQLATAEAELERIRERAQHWRVACSAAASELEIHLASLAAKLETLCTLFEHFLGEAKESGAERLIELADCVDGKGAVPARSRAVSGRSSAAPESAAPSLTPLLDELARLISSLGAKTVSGGTAVEARRRSLVSILSVFATSELAAIELAGRVIGSRWPQARFRDEEQAIARFRETWTSVRAAYGALERRALSMGAQPRGISSGGGEPLVFDFEAETRKLSEARAALEARVAEMDSSIDALRTRHSLLGSSVERARALLARRRELSVAYDASSDEFGKREMLDRLLSGSLNPQRKMPFKNYVLGMQFKEIAARASERLYRMSSGRYVVEADILSGGGNKKIGLELSVFDAWNGGTRPVGTLSGGEKFMLSISLALGLADSIQERAGANRIESLFIDEGFGSLDEESLSLAISVLDELRGDKKIAIISHVEELCNRIPSRIVVKKGVGGSRLEFERG